MSDYFIARIIAVIGMAGRDKNRVMNKALWTAMVLDLKNRLRPTDVLVSGGAAWADHLAVHAYLQGWCARLCLFFPAPFQRGQFAGEYPSSGNTANYYHKLFYAATNVDGLHEIELAMNKGAVTQAEEILPGYAGMFARNKKVAVLVTSVIAYTFGDGDVPADGGTLSTWKQIKSDDKIHVPLSSLSLT